jgi:hypothetical protein
MHEGKGPLRKPMRNWKNDIKLDLTDSSGSGSDPLSDSYKTPKRIFGFHKG